MIEDTGIVDCCFILVECFCSTRPYAIVATQDCSKGPDLLAQ
jgi:hypothetical protein